MTARFTHQYSPMAESSTTPQRTLHVDCQIPPEYAGQRLDQALAQLLPDYSRARLQQWLKAGHIQVDGQLRRARDRVLGGERVSGQWSEPATLSHRGQAIPLDICYEDAELLIINKPAGLVVHPAAGNPDGTLLNALLHHAPELAALPRAGLVHRLDKDTTGLLVVARTLRAHSALVEQLQQRTLGREYQAVVNGRLVAGGCIDAPLGRHPVDRKRMAVVSSGKTAITHYRVQTRFRAHTQVHIQLQTGRTHQIRVHFSHRRHPIVGDPLYGGRPRVPAQASAECIEALRSFPRQALHAARLSLIHPASGEPLSCSAELPDDMVNLLSVLHTDQAGCDA